MSFFAESLPLGQITVATGGTTLLSTNCGSLQGTITGVIGRAFTNVTIQAATTNTDVVYLLPRGKSYAANPEAVYGVIFPGETVADMLHGAGILPEQFVLDSPTAGQIVFGIGKFS